MQNGRICGRFAFGPGFPLALGVGHRLSDLGSAHRLGGDQCSLVVIGQRGDVVEKNESRRDGGAEGHGMLEDRVRHDVCSCSFRPEGGHLSARTTSEKETGHLPETFAYRTAAALATTVAR